MTAGRPSSALKRRKEDVKRTFERRVVLGPDVEVEPAERTSFFSNPALDAVRKAGFDVEDASRVVVELEGLGDRDVGSFARLGERVVLQGKVEAGCRRDEYS